MIESLLWVEKYRPKKMAEFIGNDKAKNDFLDWIQKKRRTKKAVLLYGPPGVGKTSLVNIVAKEFGFRVIEMNASDTRSEKAIREIADPATSFVALDTFSTDIKGNILFLDEVDGIAGNEDRGGVSAIIKIIEKAHVPVIMAANNPDLEKLRPLKKICLLIQFQELTMPQVVLVLQKICKEEHVKAESEALEQIAQHSQGDVRSAINDLQSLAEIDKVLTVQDTKGLSYRNKDIGMNKILMDYFSARSILEASILLSHSGVDHDELLMAISDNIPSRYSDPKELSKAYDFISQADIIRGRIGVENWHLLKYFFNSLSKAIGFSPNPGRPFTPITIPIRVITLFWTKGKRTILDGICAKMGKHCHVSRKIAKEQFIPFIKIMLEKGKADLLFNWLELQPEEIDFLSRMSKF